MAEPTPEEALETEETPEEATTATKEDTTDVGEEEATPVIELTPCEIIYPPKGGDPITKCYVEVPTENVHMYKNIDTIQYANDIGRLDLVTIVLGVLALAIGLFSIVGYNQVRYRSKQIAEETAKETAEKAAKNRVDEITPKLIYDAVKLFGVIGNKMTDEDADKIGKSQPDGSKDG